MAKTQLEIVGTEHPTGDADLDALAAAFKRSSKQRKAAQDKEIGARDVLIDAMKRKKLTTYENRSTKPPQLVVLSSIEKVSVEEIADEAEIEDDEDGDDGEPKSKKATQKEAKA